MSKTSAFVAGEHQPAGDEERFQQPGGVTRAAPGTAAVRDRGDDRDRPLDTGVQRPLHAAEVPQADRWC